MSVTNRRNATDANVVVVSEWRVRYENVTLGASGVKVLAVESAPIQYVTATGTGTAIRLPLAAKDGTLFLIAAANDSTNTTVVTDDAGSPVTIATLTSDASALFMKRGAAYVCILEGAAIA